MYKKRQTKIRETEHFKETTIQIHRTNEQWIGTDDIQISIILCFNIPAGRGGRAPGGDRSRARSRARARGDW